MDKDDKIRASKTPVFTDIAAYFEDRAGLTYEDWQKIPAFAEIAEVVFDIYCAAYRRFDRQLNPPFPYSTDLALLMDFIVPTRFTGDHNPLECKEIAGLTLANWRGPKGATKFPGRAYPIPYAEDTYFVEAQHLMQI